MGWHFWAALVGALVAASLIDWLFAGVLFHDRYMRHPEVWRTPGSNTRGIIVAQVLTIPTVIGMMILNTMLFRWSLEGSLTIAVLVWAIAAAPATIVNGIFVKLDPLVVAAHATGWLVKLLAVSAIAVLLP